MLKVGAVLRVYQSFSVTLLVQTSTSVCETSLLFGGREGKRKVLSSIHYRNGSIRNAIKMQVMKTTDRKNVYKVADVSQIMVCSNTADISSSKRILKTKSNKAYLWPDGLTPPMKNARKKRFRKAIKKKYVDVPEIERELKMLLRTDIAAESVRWEVVQLEKDNARSQAETNGSVAVGC
uniref:TAFII55 protein conserved region domain-containing protein n=1 Tax=Parascaris univalens TaxID=6257 RepID=A0A914ZZZ9_PARUN